MSVLLHPTYFPNVGHVVAMLRHPNSVVFETYDNYQKQSFRNRTEIYGPNGKLSLTVPVNYTQKQRQMTKDVKIANISSWQNQHLKSLQSAYSMAPFYEFYVDDLKPIFQKSFRYILDLNLYSFEIICNLLDIKIRYALSTYFEKQTKHLEDFRSLVHRNTVPKPFPYYTQVFTEKHGYISNLSIIDVLFNEGPNTELYLRGINSIETND